MKRKSALPLKLIGLALMFTTLGESAVAEVRTLSQVVEKAKANSPELQALRNQVHSAERRAAQAIAPSQPSLSFTYQDINTPYHGIGLGDQASRQIAFVQPVNFPGKGLLNMMALDAQTESLRAQLRAQELSVAMNAKTSYYQLQLARENLLLNDEQHKFYERIFAIARRRYEGGQITQVDLLNSEVALHSNENDTVDLQSAVRTARTQLNVSLGDPPETEFEVEPLNGTKKPQLNYADVEAKMTERRSELRAARALLLASQKSFRLAELSVLPDFQFTAGTTIYDITGASPLSSSNPEANHTYFAGVQMTLPIWFMFDQVNTISAAHSDRAAAEAALKSTLNQSLVLLKQTFESYSASQTKVKNFAEHIVPLSDQALNIAIINYGAGKIDFQALFDSATARRSVRQNYSNTIVNYLTAYSTLGQLMGEEL